MTPKTKATAPNLKRGMQILEYLATHQGNATIAELTERLGFPSASVYRILHVLHELGYLSRDSSKRYTLTNKLLRFGQPQNGQRGLVEAAIAPLRGLRKATGETSQICCLTDTDAVVLEQLVSVHPFKYSTDIGARVPCYSCAPGKAILAWLPDEDLDGVVSRITFQRFTSTTITSRRRLKEELKAIRDRGYAIDDGEGLEGIRCVAAPILNGHDHAVGAVTIAAPASRLPKTTLPETGEIVREAADVASLAYGK